MFGLAAISSSYTRAIVSPVAYSWRPDTGITEPKWSRLTVQQSHQPMTSLAGCHCNVERKRANDGRGSPDAGRVDALCHYSVVRNDQQWEQNLN